MMFPKNYEIYFHTNPVGCSFLKENYSEGDISVTSHFPRLLGMDKNEFFDLIVVCGLPDQNDLVRWIHTRPQETFLIYEPELQKAEIWIQTAPKGLIESENIFIVVGHQESLLSTQISLFFRNNPFRLTKIFRSRSVVLGGSATQAELFLAQLQNEIQKFLKLITPNEEDAFWGFLNTVENAPTYYSRPHLHEAQNYLKNIPGILVSAGPSLDQTLSLIKAVKGRCLICAVDSAVKPLSRAGIVPDLVVTLERVGEIQRFFSTLTGYERVPLIAPSVVGKNAFDAYPGPIWQIYVNSGCDSWFVEDPKVDDLGGSPSVSHLGYMALAHLGCNPIALFGQDLCYHPKTGTSHNSQNSEIAHVATDGQLTAAGKKLPVVTLPGNDGQTRQSMPYWISFAERFRLLVPRTGVPTYNVIPKDYGIPIPETQRIDPEHFLSHFANDSKTEMQQAWNHLINKFAERAVPSLPMNEKLKKISEALLFLHQESLKAMRDLSTTWRDHDMSFPKAEQDYAAIYRGLFSRTAERLKSLQSYSPSFWKKSFQSLIMNSYLGLQIERASLMANEPDWVTRTHSLLQIELRLFNLIQLWSARCLEAIQNSVKFTTQ